MKCLETIWTCYNSSSIYCAFRPSVHNAYTQYTSHTK